MEFATTLASNGLPPLRIAGAGTEGEEEQTSVVAPKQIEEHEVETYREQDVRSPFSAPLPSTFKLIFPPPPPAPPDFPRFPPLQRYLPIANVGRIMKKCLPDTTKVSKDAKECVQECTSEFISFITSEAAERCAVEKRKTINGEDILFAMNTLGFDMYAEILKVYLAKYREVRFFLSSPSPLPPSLTHPIFTAPTLDRQASSETCGKGGCRCSSPAGSARRRIRVR
jgi:nuclear transcription Y subunit beta